MDTHAIEVETARRALALTAEHRLIAVTLVGLGLLGAALEVGGLAMLIPLSRLVLEHGAPDVPQIVDPAVRGLAPGLFATPFGVAAIVVSAMLAGIIVNWINTLASNRLAMTVGDTLRRRVFAIALHERIAAIEAMPDGSLSNLLASETWRVGDVLFTLIGAATQALTCLVFLVALIALSPALTALLIAMSLLMALVVHLATRGATRLGADAVAANEAFMADMWDLLAGLRVIHAHGRQDFARARFDARSGAARRVFIRLGVLSGAVGPLTQIMIILTIAALLGAAMLSASEPTMLLGFMAIAYRMQPRVVALLRARVALRSMHAPVAAVAAAIERADAASDLRNALPAAPTPNRIARVALRSVTARWPSGAAPAIHEVDCVFEGGRVTALVGASGAGKSTLAATLLGFLEPEAGSVEVDGVAGDPAWRAGVAFVDQASFLFRGSFAENLRLGAPHASDTDLVRAGRAAGAHDFIVALPDGYQTPTETQPLSWGQRQRVALARALLRDPAVLILDEATNALDLPTERIVGEALRAQARRGAVVIVIAHRREAIDVADAAVVLKAGRVVETGAPTSLLRSGGVFSALYATPPQESPSCPG